MGSICYVLSISRKKYCCFVFVKYWCLYRLYQIFLSFSYRYSLGKRNKTSSRISRYGQFQMWRKNLYDFFSFNRKNQWKNDQMPFGGESNEHIFQKKYVSAFCLNFLKTLFFFLGLWSWNQHLEMFETHCGIETRPFDG